MWQLICAFVLANAKSRFSHDMANMNHIMQADPCLNFFLNRREKNEELIDIVKKYSINGEEIIEKVHQFL